MYSGRPALTYYLRNGQGLVRSAPSWVSPLCARLFNSVPLSLTGHACEDRRSILAPLGTARKVPGELGAGGLKTGLAGAPQGAPQRKLVIDHLCAGSEASR